jgi:glutathione S-transferase
MSKKKRYHVPERRPRRVIPTEGEADAKREIGMARAEGNSGPEWAMLADDFIENHLRVHDELFADHLWLHGLEMPISPRALGPRFRVAAGKQFMESTGTYRNSVSSNNSARPVWRSLIFEGEAHCEAG